MGRRAVALGRVGNATGVRYDAGRMGTCGPDGRYRPGDGQPPVDIWTGWHAAIGVAYGAVGVPWEYALSAAVLWEVVENPLKDRLPEIFPDACHDTLGNAVADVAAVMVGYALGRYWRKGR